MRPAVLRYRAVDGLLQRLLHWLGFGLCHQLPERSFFGGGVQVPVCARDTGIYVGFVISLALVTALHRGERPRGFPRPATWTLMGLFVAFMVWDGVSSYSGMRVTNNDLRLITGLVTGFSAAVVVFPMLQDELWRVATRERVLDPFWRLLVWAMCIPASFAVIRWVAPSLGVVYPMAVAVSIIATLTAINLVIVAMLPAFDRRADSIVDLVSPVAIAAGFSIVEIAAAGLFRIAADNFIRGLGG